MAETKYTKSISSDFSAGVNINRFTSEIQSSSITIAFDRIVTGGDVCDVWFKAALSAGEQTALTALCTAHDGTALLDDTAQLVKVQEEGATATGGAFRSQVLKIEIPAGDVDDITIKDYSWPFPISALSCQIYPSTENVGDELVVCVDPQSVIGTITADVGIGENTIYLSPATLAYVSLGQKITLDDTTNADDMGYVIEKTSTYIKTVSNATHAFTAATPTYVKRCVFMFAPGEFELFKADVRIALGNTKIGGSYIPKDIIFRASYKNKTTSAKTFYAVFDYLY